jgi:hypothetical protein
MKRTIATFSLFAAASIALATNASAQEQPFQANVPFNFTVGNRELPTGSYLVRTFGSRQVQIENMHQNISTYVLANAGNRLRNDNKKLVFDKVGGQYFLREIVSTSEAVEFPKSQSEKQAQILVNQTLVNQTPVNQTLVKQSADTEASTFTAEQN